MWAQGADCSHATFHHTAQIGRAQEFASSHTDFHHRGNCYVEFIATVQSKALVPAASVVWAQPVSYCHASDRRRSLLLAILFFTIADYSKAAFHNIANMCNQDHSPCDLRRKANRRGCASRPTSTAPWASIIGFAHSSERPRVPSL